MLQDGAPIQEPDEDAGPEDVGVEELHERSHQLPSGVGGVTMCCY